MIQNDMLHIQINAVLLTFLFIIRSWKICIMASIQY